MRTECVALTAQRARRDARGGLPPVSSHGPLGTRPALRLRVPRVLIASLISLVVAGCAPDPRTCLCGASAPTLYAKSFLEGDFFHRVASVSVIDGTYVASPLDDARVATELTFSEGHLLGAIGEGVFALRVHAHVELAEEDPSVCRCGPALVTPAPPWAECHHAAIDVSSELGGYPLSEDDGLSAVEPLPSWDVASDLPFALDDDRAGFTLRARYLVTPEGCDATSCRSVVEVVHHFRRA